MKKLTYRYIARIVLEAQSPFSIGSGKVGLNADQLFTRDFNRLPYIPGTSLAGILRHHVSQLESTDVNELFGSGGSDGSGSRIHIGSALLLAQNGREVIESPNILPTHSAYYEAFRLGLTRDHVKITHRGVAAPKSKFETELVPQGARFCFEMELQGTEADQQAWNNLIQHVYSSEFRVGAGSRKGFGRLSPVQDACFQCVLDLEKKPDLDAYLSKSSSLNQSFEPFERISLSKDDRKTEWKVYTVKISPKDFHLFGAGFGDQDVDKVSKTEFRITWDESGGSVTSREHILIPGTSIKGALAHRVAYHYNKQRGHTAQQRLKVDTEDLSPEDLNQVIHSISKKFENDVDTSISLESMDGLNEEQLNQLLGKLRNDLEKLDNQIKGIDTLDPKKTNEWQTYEKSIYDTIHQEQRKKTTGPDNMNPAVKALFGSAKNTEIDEKGQRGNVMIPDIIRPFESKNQKVFQHVKIDRFTGGAIDSALFNEKAYSDQESFSFDIHVASTCLADPEIKNAWESALKDLIDGNLSLGGMTNKGYGLFKGTFNTQP